jgi:hypothetical protein
MLLIQSLSLARSIALFTQISAAAAAAQCKCCAVRNYAPAALQQRTLTVS